MDNAQNENRTDTKQDDDVRQSKQDDEVSGDLYSSGYVEYFKINDFHCCCYFVISLLMVISLFCQLILSN
jgi:hypothetical protein